MRNEKVKALLPVIANVQCRALNFLSDFSFLIFHFLFLKTSTAPAPEEEYLLPFF